MIGRTLTPHFHIETRQHELFNFDLGASGIPRKQLVVGVVVVLAWVGGLWALLGAPTRNTSTLYMLPPILFAYYAFMDSEVQPRRKRMTQWAVRGRYLVAGHKPVIGLGARPAYRSELLPLGGRVDLTWLRKQFAAWFGVEAVAPASDEGPWASDGIQAGAPIRLNQSAHLFGFDHMTQVRTRGKRSKK